MITQRRPGTPYPGYWEFPGGKALPGEPIHACITRELREELAIDIEIAATLPRVIHTYRHATVDLTPAIARLAPGSPQPRAIDVADWRWCPLDQLPWDSFLPANARIVTRIARFLADEHAP